MGDVRFREPYERVAKASDRSAVLRRLSDSEAAAALGGASHTQDPYLANVLATELLNRIRQKDSLLANVADGLLAADSHGRITSINAAVERLLGWQEGELLGRDVHHTLCFRGTDGGYIQRPSCPFVRTLEDGLPRQGQSHIVRKDGSLLPITYTLAAIVQDEDVQGGVLAFQDATKLVEAMARQAREASRFRQAVEHGPVYAYIARLEPPETHWLCPRLEAQLGFSPTEWRHDLELGQDPIHPDDRERVLQAWRASLASGSRFACEYRARTGDGRYVWLRDEAVAVHSEVGKPLEFVGALLDVTERKRQEERHALRREELERLAFGLSLGVKSAAIFVFDPSGRIVFANRAAEQIFGTSHEEMSSLAYKEWGNRLRTADGAPFPLGERPFRRAMLHRTPVEGILVRVLRPDGTSALVQADAVPVLDPDTGEVLHVVGTFVQRE